MSNSSTAIKTVPFHGHDLITIQDGETVRVAMKPICDAIGLQWEAQLKRIKRHATLSEGLSIMDIPSKGGVQQFTTLPIDMLNGWLFGVDVNRVKPEIRDYLLMYQRECFQVLYGYWQKGIAVNPRIPLTPDHQRGIQKAVARRAQALPKGLQRLAYSRLYSHLKDRFDVAKYDQIPDEQYTQALAAIETCELDGEWMPAPEEPTGRLGIHYPMSRWPEINHGLAYDWKNQVPQGYNGREVWFVRPGRLCGDVTDHGSPTMVLLRELTDAGYNVECCQAEINAMRSTISELDSLQQRVLQIAKCGNAYPLIVQH